MKKKFFFTIITVFLNDSSKITETLNSLYIQTCQDYEHIVKDGLSEKEELECLKKHISEHKSILISEPDNGIYNAMNQALKISNGSFVYFLNAGDIFSDAHVLERVKKFIQQNPKYRIFFGDVTFYPTLESTNYSDNITKRVIFNKTICHQGIFTCSQALLEIDGFREKMFLDQNFQAIQSDQESLWKLIFDKGYKAIKLPFKIAIHEYGGFSTSSNIFVKSWSDRAAILISMFGLFEFMIYGFLTFICAPFKTLILHILGTPYTRTWKSLVIHFFPSIKRKKRESMIQ
jgi:glycosyltransferase involved in cell wall biosynthesis